MSWVVPRTVVTALAVAVGAERVSLGDIEDQLRGAAGKAQEAIAESKATALASAVVAGVAVVAAAYLHGRRRGRRRASVLEIRRV